MDLNEENKVNQESEDLENPNIQDIDSEEVEKNDDKPHRVDEIDGELNIKETHGDFKPITYTYEESVSFDDEVESFRKSYLPKYKLYRLLNYGSMALLVLGFACIIIPMFLNISNASLKIVLMVVGIALVVAAIVISIISSKKMQQFTINYSYRYFELIAGYTAYELSVNDVYCCPGANMDETLFIQAHMFRTITNIQSSSVMEGRRHGHDFVAGFLGAIIPPVSYDKANELPSEYINMDATPYIAPEFGATVTGSRELPTPDMTVVDLNLANEENSKAPVKKNAAPRQSSNNLGLFGWFTSYTLPVKSEESLIIYFLGKRTSNILPDYLTGFRAVKVPSLRSDIVVFAADIKASGKFFTNRAIEYLNNVKPDDIFQSGFISINSYGAKIGLNLDDCFINAPAFKEGKRAGNFASYDNAMKNLFGFLDEIEGIQKKDEE